MSEARQTNQLRLIMLLIGCAGVALAFVVKNWMSQVDGHQAPIPTVLFATLLPEAKPLQPFTLKDHDDKPFTLDRFKGVWTFLFFGYAHCPDVCPTSMGELALIFSKLDAKPALRANTRGVFVSVDPQRDTTELLKSYVPYFHPEFLGVTGSPDDVATFSRQVGAGYIVQPGESPEAYTIAHTSSFFLIDPKGKLTAVFSGPHDSDKVVEKYSLIREYYQGEQK
ncbi:MAG: SCO family protein [Magnetococcales bacterium]|nr:SCO family protein [Magnetococcales bacterium]